MSTPPNSITQTIAQYGKRLFGFIRGRVRSEEEAEDILQEVWYQLSKVADVEAIGSVSGWLFQVARNKITDTYRRQSPDSLDDYRQADEEGAWGLADLLPDDAQLPDDEFFRELFWQELTRALDELPANQREVFVQNELEDKTLQQIADEAGEPLKTIISRKRYAVQFLRKRLQTLYEDLNE